MVEGPATLTEFRNWASGYLKAAPAVRLEMEATGRALAAARRPVFHELIKSDPRTALQEAVPMVTRQQLPPSITHLLENRVAARGVIRNYWAPPSAAPDAAAVIRYAELENGPTYRAHVYGRFENKVEWTMNASLNGVELEGDMAVNESPLRPLEVGEIPDPAKLQVTVCPVSEQETTPPPSSSPITEETPAVEAYARIVYLCDGSHTILYEKILVQGEASSGGTQVFTGILPAAPTPSVGMVKVLFIRAVFPDHQQVPCSEAAAYEMLRQTAEFFQTNSAGRVMVVGTVTPPIMMPNNQTWYFSKDLTAGYIREIDGLSIEMAHAKEEAKKLGFDWNDYHCTVLRDNLGSGGPSRGGSGNVWLRGDDLGVMTHEIGHAFRLDHANFWDTNGSSVIGPGANAEYGNNYDNMGGANPPEGHYNAQAKNQIKWLPDSFVPDVVQSGPYRIHAFDTGSLQSGLRYALKIRKDATRTYWGEFRTLFSSNPAASNGLILGWKWPGGGGNNIHLLDTTPGSTGNKLDAPLVPGRTFSDMDAGIHITTLGVNTDTTPRSIDVQVNFGTFSGNQPPTSSVSPTSVVVPLNVPVTFQATATDPDGDVLAYGWHWADQTLSPNSPTVTRSFSGIGVYSATCIVSDMKGGRSIRNLLITVGNGGNRFTISGRITQHGAGLAGLRVSAGPSSAITDDNGNYSIASLAAGTYSVIPAAMGFVFSEQFNNSVTVGPSFQGADFTADALPSISLSAPVPSTVEGGAPGRFRVTRTGNLSAPLNVNLIPATGTATKTTDYVPSPDYGTSPFWQVEIPADESSIDVTITSVDDAVQEGAESVIVMLANDSGYVTSSQAPVTVTIDDNDTSLPRVTLTSNLAQIEENAGSSIVCTVTRSGSTAAPLTVPYLTSGVGSAIGGQDYAPLSGSVQIPAGAVSATFLLTPINDSESEAPESVHLSIQTGALLIAGAEASSVSLEILDDDLQTVSLNTTDGNAAEVDRTLPGAVPNPGTFVVTRTGDITKDLRVYYSVSGTALHGVDYELLTGSILIPAGESRAALNITPRVDDFGEPPETVLLVLAPGNPGYKVGAAGSGTVTINDSGTSGPLVEITTSSAEMAEPASASSFLFTARGSGTGPLMVRYAVSGSAVPGADYTIAGLDNATGQGTVSLTLNNGIATFTLPVTPINDTALEELESVQIELLPDAAYRFWEMTYSTKMLLRDDDQPLVLVDAQVGNGGAESVAENFSSTVCKFFISRSGSTATPLTVNYSLQGTATPGADYTALPGSVVIPAGAAGVDIILSPRDDAIFEGTETVVLHLESGSYARGPDAVFYITDAGDGTSYSVTFPSISGSGSESQTTVSIPVTVSASHSTPVSVQYFLDSGQRATTTMPATVSNTSFPCWLRMVRNATVTQTYYSQDGVSWVAQGNAIINGSMPTSSYLVGLAAGSGTSGQSCTAVFDQVSITGLSAGGTVQGAVEGNIGTPNPAGSSSIVNGTYTLTSGGAGFYSGASDLCRFTSFAVSNSLTFTLTARLVSFTGSGGVNSRAGLMMRESAASNDRQVAWSTNLSNVNGQSNRTAAGNGIQTTSIGTIVKPCWLRLQRVGNLFTASTSLNGTNWTTLGNAQTIPLSTSLVAGLTVSAKENGLLTKAVFDQFSLTPSSIHSPQAGSIGFAAKDGYHSEAGGVWTVAGSGAGIAAGSDSGYFISAPVKGDFTMTVRVLSQEGGGNAAQAGIMARESHDAAARFVYAGTTLNFGAEFLFRRATTSTAQGLGLDHNLVPGVLNFAVGEITKNIVFNVVDDKLAELPETITVGLRYANGATGTPQYTYIIIDNDSISVPPALGFAGVASTGLETESPARIPVSLTETSELPVDVNFSVTGGSATPATDYTAVSGVLHFAPGQTTAFIEVPILNDSVQETAESFTVTLDSPVNAVLTGNAGHAFTIQDEDTPIVSITTSDASAKEAGNDPGVFTFSRTGSTTAALLVRFTRSGSANSGTDFVPFSPLTTVTIPAGQPSVNLVVNPINDSTIEVGETIILALAPDPAYVLAAATSATVTLDDDDANVVSIAAATLSIPESGSSQGQFILTRTGSTAAGLTVNIVSTGTATQTVDYSSISSTATFAAGQSSVAIPITSLPDSLTEGSEAVVVSISSSVNYVIGVPFASMTILDDDSPPTVFISNPSIKVANISEHHGLLLAATAADDGFPQAVSYLWSRVFGPGEVTFEDATAASTGARFSAPGLYLLRVTVTDGQFSASDEVFAQVGGFSLATWIGIDQMPSAKRGASGPLPAEGFLVSGGGTGYTSAQDSGHLMFRQLMIADGNGSITARLTSLNAPASGLAGLAMRDSSANAAKRVLLTLGATGTLQFHQRTTVNTASSATTVATGLAPPLWLRLTRVNGTITASYAPDAGGVPGSYTDAASSSVTMENNFVVGMVASAGVSSSAITSATFDHLAADPPVTGPATHSEDIGSPAVRGSSSEVNGVVSITGTGFHPGGGHFRYQQVWGDCTIVGRLASNTGGSRGAQTGIAMRDVMDTSSANTFAGTQTIDGGTVTWATASGGAGGSGNLIKLASGVGTWMRLTRRGNVVNAYRASDVNGAPGNWTSLTGNIAMIVSGPLLVGCVADSNINNQLATGSVSGFTITPLNAAPSITPGEVGTYAPFHLQATVIDEPPYTVEWTGVSGPGTVTFADSTAAETVATLSIGGTYRLRLTASDYESSTYKDLTFTGWRNGYEQWQSGRFTGGAADPEGNPLLDPDRDGLVNLLEYALGTDPRHAAPAGLVKDTATVGGLPYLRLTLSKNPDAVGVSYQAQATSNLADPGSWTAAGLIIEEDSPTTLRVRDYLPLNLTPRRFLRVRVSE